jgi:hypothetical protein
MPSLGTNPTIDYVPYFEGLIFIQESAIVSFKRWAVVFVLIGGAIIGLALVPNSPVQGVVSQVTGIGGVFISALSAFPYREIAPRRSRIVTYVLLKQGFEKFPSLSDEDRKRLRDLADETIRKQI